MFLLDGHKHGAAVEDLVIGKCRLASGHNVLSGSIIAQLSKLSGTVTVMYKYPSWLKAVVVDSPHATCTAWILVGSITVEITADPPADAER
jgi:hypothetical protein